MGLETDGRFMIHVDETDSHQRFVEEEPDVTTHDAIFERIREGQSTDRVARHVIVAQELDLLVDPVPPPRTALHMGMSAVIASIVGARKKEHNVDGGTITTRELVNNRPGRRPVYTESDFEDDEEEETGDIEHDFDFTYLEVAPGNDEVARRAENHLMTFVVSNVRNRLSEIAVADGMDAMRQAASAFKAEVDAVVCALGEPSNP